ncbi:MAG: hypothetical protein WB495_19990 [Xanthobacteraceae bacterium]
MRNNKSKQSDKPERQTKARYERNVAAAALLAVLAAGIITYRTANDDIHTAASDTIPAPALSLR